jgi:hypothetical protein
MRKLTLFSTILAIQHLCFGIDRLVPSQYPTINSAINAVAPGDTIIISPGVYAGRDNSNLSIIGKSVKIRSSDPANAEIVANTVIDCYGAPGADNPAFRLDSNAILILDGITVSYGFSSATGGGGIHCHNSTAIIKNCEFDNCMSLTFGGTIYADSSYLRLDNCAIYDSCADQGGGAIYSDNSEMELHDCTISEAFAGDEYGGGAIYADTNSKLTVDKSLLTNNTSLASASAIYVRNTDTIISDSNFTYNVLSNMVGAGIGAIYSVFDSNYGQIVITRSNFSENHGGGIDCQRLTASQCSFVANIGNAVMMSAGGQLSSSLIAGNYGTGIYCTDNGSYVIQNCTIADNLAGQQIGIYGGNQAKISLTNCILWGTEVFANAGTIAYCDVGGIRDIFPFGTVFSRDPLFVKPGQWQNNAYISGDYHLQLNSPCINAGDPNTVIVAGDTDLDGNARIRFGRIDIGAYEAGTHPMDFDQNGIVDFRDFGKFAQAWLWTAIWH